MIIRQKINLCLAFLAYLATACTLVTDGPNKKVSNGLIATPINYYSTPKARYLAAKYTENLGRIAERIIRNPKTAQLQFANNISSVGGIGFFTHSATETPDERYLEVVLATPETFASKGKYSDKVQQLFSLYGSELLAIIAGDNEIFQDKELRGYGLNLAWRTVVSEPGSSQVSLARAIIYFHKEKVAEFLRQALTAHELLRDGVIFAVEDNGPLELVSYQARETKPDSRPAIREDDLPPSTAKPAPMAPSTTSPKTEKKDAPGGKRDLPVVSVPEPTSPAAKESLPTERDKGDKVALKQEPLEEAGRFSSSVKPHPASKSDSLPKREGLGSSRTITRPEMSKTANDAAPNLPQAVHSPKKQTNEQTAEIPSPKNEIAEANKPATQSSAEQAGKQSRPVVPEISSGRSGESVTLKPKQESLAPEIAAPEIAGTKNSASEGGPRASRLEEGQGKVLAAQRSKLENRGTVPVPVTLPEKQARSETKATQPATSPERKTAGSERKTAVAQAGVANANARAPEPLGSEPAQTKAAEKKTAEVNKSVREPVNSPPAAGEQGEKKASSPTSGKAKRSTEQQIIPAPERVPVERTGIKPGEPAVSSRDPEATASPVVAPQLAAKRDVAKPLESDSLISLPKGENRETRVREITRAPLTPPVGLAAPREAPEALAKSTTAPSPIDAPEPRRTEITPNVAIGSPAHSPLPAWQSTPPPTRRIGPDPRVAIETQPRPTSPAGREHAGEQPAAEQLALLRKPPQVSDAKKTLPRPAPRFLEGFVLQFAFSDKEKARSWAENMERRGFAVSVTEAGAGGALRVRLGNFTGRDEAERQLRDFRKEGMRGIVINLPQAFRPNARVSLP